MKYLLLLATLAPYLLIAQSVTIKGSVVELPNETLPLAHITILPDSITIISNSNGNFIARLTPGTKNIIISYTGYELLNTIISIKKDTTLQFEMHQDINQLEEVIVHDQLDLHTEFFKSTRMSTNILKPEEVTSIPVLGGEADLIKVLQLLPGNVRGVEGSSDLFVRGGAADQNLVLLDDATIYNTSHLLGFVSVFNPDILESVTSMNGAFPANVGGRLSSILNVNTISTIADKTHMSGSIGLISSRLFIEQPIVQDKVGIWIAGRRTYVDQVIKIINEELPYFFYDMNAKLLLKPTAHDQITVSYYQGNDDLNIFRDRNNDGNGFLTAFKSGNNNQSIEWQRQLSNHWFGTVSGMRTEYDYRILNAFEDNKVLAYSDIEDIGAKVEANYFVDENHPAFTIGADWTHHVVSPSVVSSSGTFSEFLGSSTAIGRVSNELAFYGQSEWTPVKRWSILAGIRASMAFVNNKTYWTPEPRISARYTINTNQALKLSYSRMAQYIHRISNSAVSSPTDIWYPVTESISPQRAHQISVGWQQQVPKDDISISIEAYYKSMEDLIGLEEGTNLFFNSNFQSSLIQGIGKAYGLELLIRKSSGKFTGWISYTLSRSVRQFESLNEGNWFPSRYDRRHNGAIVGQYAIHPRFSISMVWEYISGARFTPIIGQYQVLAPSNTGVDLIPLFAPINSVKLADAHRLDVGIKFRNKPDAKFKYEWFAGVYNVYNRTNPVAISIETNENGQLQYEQPGLIGLLPFISYSFKF